MIIDYPSAQVVHAAAQQGFDCVAAERPGGTGDDDGHSADSSVGEDCHPASTVQVRHHFPVESGHLEVQYSPEG
jgi:hypothetical protein